MVVTILQSPDDQEICFVNDGAFRELSQETEETIDWESYGKRRMRQKKFIAPKSDGEKKLTMDQLFGE